MDESAYLVEAQVEASHWWFVVRRKLLARELERAGVSRSALVLDLGAGTGATLAMLRRTGATVHGLDVSPTAARFCRSRGLSTVTVGDAANLPYPGSCFDAVVLTDVIEHLADDSAALRGVERVLRPNGVAIITVPAFEALWGPNDDAAHHQRRYRAREVRTLAATAGLSIERGYYFNFLLFVPIWLVRRAMRLFGVRAVSENLMNPAWLNRLLTGLFAIDVALAPLLRVPFGVSYLLIARKGKG
jgi:SAM-dependent methyltransferase